MNLQYANDTLKADKEVVLAAVQSHGLALKCASLDLQADKEVVLAAFQQNMLALRLASTALKADTEFVGTVTRQLDRSPRRRDANLVIQWFRPSADDECFDRASCSSLGR